MERSAEVFNEVLRLHNQETSDCAGLFAWDMATEKRCGLRTRLAPFHQFLWILFSIWKRMYYSMRIIQNDCSDCICFFHLKEESIFSNWGFICPKNLMFSKIFDIYIILYICVRIFLLHLINNNSVSMRFDFNIFEKC